jgi:hypothetical protein
MWCLVAALALANFASTASAEDQRVAVPPFDHPGTGKAGA